MEKSIGGYFEWEFPKEKNEELHPGGVLLNGGRYALEYILRGLTKINRLWLPYFTCEVVLQPVKKLGIPYSFYRINSKLELDESIDLSSDDYLVYTNYYGIKDSYVHELSLRYRQNLIIDNAQALYCKEEEHSHQFYSPRKFLGMPDGGIVVSSLPDMSELLPQSLSYDKCMHLLKRIELAPMEGYADFKENDAKLDDSSICQMSEISKRILRSAGLREIKEIRRSNFEYLHKTLKDKNLLDIPSMDSFSCPLVYPFWTKDSTLKKLLISNNIFVATYWPNVFDWTCPGDVEYELADRIVCIPVDQRYTESDMSRIISTLSFKNNE
jgi:hypothetical protein